MPAQRASAAKKAASAAAARGEWALADDSGLAVDALGGANPYRDVPAHLKTMISNLEASAATPEEIRQVERLRDGVERHFEANGDFFEAKIQSKTKSRQLEIAFTGVNSTIKGFQQLLSAT